MNIFNFSKPKKTIFNTLYLIGLISLFISLLAISTVNLWKYYPKIVSQIDISIPDFYGNNINRLYRKAKESSNQMDTYQNFSKLYDELKDVSTLNKYYKYRQESANFLIKSHLKTDMNLALNLSKEWEKNYPNDFIGKFMYIDVLSKVDRIASFKYLKNLYSKYPDIVEVKNKYITYLISNNHYNKALNIYLENDFVKNYPKFQIYYLDNSTSFSESKSNRYNKIDYTVNNNLIQLEVNKQISRFQGIRIDLDSIINGSMLPDVNLTINGHKLSINNTNSIKLINTKYVLNGNDPYLIFNIPNELRDYSGELNISFTCGIQQNDIITSEILHNKEWKFYIDNSDGFNENDSINFSLVKNNNEFISSNAIDRKAVSSLRIDFPSLLGLKISNFKVIFDNKIIYTKDAITDLNNIKRKKEYFKIIGSDPFLTIKLKEKLNIKDLKMEILFYESINE